MILVCHIRYRELREDLANLRDDGWKVNPATQQAVGPETGERYQFMVLERPEDARRLKGLTFTGVRNFDRITDRDCIEAVRIAWR